MIDGLALSDLDSIRIDPDDGKVVISSYDRTSYAGIPWNVFLGEVSLSRQLYYDLDIEQFIMGSTLVNTLPFTQYIAGIVEANDTLTLEKNKIMALLSKTYMLFYMENQHPSVPDDVSYNAVDDARIFQKYVGDGLSQTLELWPVAVEETQDMLVLYNGITPILPYFHCSA